VRNRIVAFVFTFVIVMLAGTTRASATAFVDIYTGVWDARWEYTQGPHSSIIGNNTAHDVFSENAGSGPLVHFSPNPTTAIAYVSDVSIRCGSGEAGWWVLLSIWSAPPEQGGIYYGGVGYQHLTNIQVVQGNWYPAATPIGNILVNGTVGGCWSAPHVHYEAEGNRPIQPSYWDHQVDDAHNVPLYQMYPYSDWLVRLYNS
jgi:hypothetical protein